MEGGTWRREDVCDQAANSKVTFFTIISGNKIIEMLFVLIYSLNTWLLISEHFFKKQLSII